MKINESNFVEQMLFRNEKALEYVVDEYGRLVKSVVRKHLFSLEEFQGECMNDVFLAVWDNISSYKPDKSSFANWIAGIARFKSIDYKRKYLNKENAEDLDMVTVGVEDKNLIGIIEDELSKEMEELLDCLMPEDRDLFIKLYVEGMNPEELSNVTGLKKEVIYNRVSRGKKKIRNLFSGKKGVEKYE